MAWVIPGTWPLMPFPQVHPVELAALVGVPFGLVLRRAWAPLLPLTLLVALNPPSTGLAGAIVAFLILGPFSTVGICLGLAAGRRLQRRALRVVISRGAARAGA
jgi:hypothetical protein